MQITDCECKQQTQTNTCHINLQKISAFLSQGCLQLATNHILTGIHKIQIMELVNHA